MKLRYFLPITLLLFFSCQSEYQKQLAEARKLILSEQQIKSSASVDFRSSSLESLNKIKKELRFQAHMSGNEESFMKEVEKYRKNVVLGEHSKSPMITRFP